MKRLPLNDLRLEPSPFERLPQALRTLFAGLFFLQAACVCATLGFGMSSQADRWPYGVLIVLASAALITALLRDLPGQNLIAIGVIACLIGGTVHTLNGLTSIPFGPCLYLHNAGQLLFPPLPWSLPILWLTVFLAARGCAQAVLGNLRGARNYGLWLSSLSTALILGFSLSLEAFAQRNSLWQWGITKLPLTWYSAPVTNFLGWGLTGMLIVLFCMPFLLVKKPGPQRTDYLPLMVWSALQICLLVAAFTAHQWRAVVVSGVLMILPAVAGLRNWITERRQSERLNRSRS
jgi:uncharacterized membrane protein